MIDYTITDGRRFFNHLADKSNTIFGCGHAYEAPGHGRKKIEELMQQRFPGNYKVTEDGCLGRYNLVFEDEKSEMWFKLRYD